MRKAFRITFLAALLAVAPAFADGTKLDLSTIDLVQSSLGTALDGIFNSLTNTCVKWLGGFLLLQMIWTQIMGMINGADIEKAWGKWLMGFFWAGLCLYIYESGADFIRSIANYIMNLAAGLTGQPFTPTYPITTGLADASDLLKAFDKGQSILGSLNPFPAIMMGLISLVILAACTLIAFRIFMIAVETKIVIALSPISFALMGLNALRDQGFAPIKYLIAMGYRIFVLGAVLAAMTSFSHALVAVFQNLPASNSPSVWPPIWAAAIGYSLLGALAWNSNSIAAHLASGSSAMTTADLGGPAAMASAVGGAVGAAVGQALGGSINKAAGKAGQALSDWRKDAGMGMSNASDNGAADLGAAALKPDFSPSLGGNAVGGGSPAGGGDKPGDSGKSDGAPPPAGNPNDGFGGVPNGQGESQRDAGRDAAREARRQVRQGGGSGENAGIGGADSGAPPKPKSDEPKKKGVMDYLGKAHDQAMRSQAPAVHVTLNTHHGD